MEVSVTIVDISTGPAVVCDCLGGTWPGGCWKAFLCVTIYIALYKSSGHRHNFVQVAVDWAAAWQRAATYSTEHVLIRRVDGQEVEERRLDGKAQRKAA